MAGTSPGSGGYDAVVEREAAELTLRDYLVPIRSFKWLILGLVVVITAIVVAYEASRTQTYTASTRVFIGSIASPTNSQAQQATPEAVANQAVLLTDNENAAQVAKAIGYTGSPSSLSSAVTATPSANTNFITITAQDASPTLAARVANGFARQFIAQNSTAQIAANNQEIGTLRKQLAQFRGATGAAQRDTINSQIQQLQLANASVVSNVTQIDPAQPPATPNGTPVWEYGVLAALAALIGSILLAYVLHRLDPRLKSVNEVAGLYDQPVLATVMHDSEVNCFVGGLPALSPRSQEAFREIRVALELAPETPLRTIMVTSASPNEGKSVVARNLAIAYAEVGRRVLLLDLDLRKGALVKRLGLDAVPGVTDVLAGSVSLDDAITRVELTSPVVRGLNGAQSGGDMPRFALTFLGAGTTPANPPAVLESPGFRKLLADVAANHDVVVLDSTPVTAVSDAVPVFAQVDGLVLVARSDGTDRRSARRAVDLISRVPGANVVGVVVNDVPPADASAYGLGYGYGYGEPSKRRIPLPVPGQD